MEYIQLKKDGYLFLVENIVNIPNLYSSPNRRAYIAKWGLALSNRVLTLQTIQQSLNYFKKLQVEAVKNNLNKNTVLLSNVINILEKYNIK